MMSCKVGVLELDHFDDLFSISKRHVAHNAKELLELLAFAGDRHEGEIINAERAVVKVPATPKSDQKSLFSKKVILFAGGVEITLLVS